MSKLIENDVRLMRRVLVALRYKDEASANSVALYLRHIRGLNLVFPPEQTEEQRERFLNRLLEKEKWLSRKYGCVLLPDYDGKGSNDCVFLNSMWANPYTLYVRLVTPVNELGDLGEIYWTPESEKHKWETLAKDNHAVYLKAITVSEKPQSWWRKLSNELAHILR